MKKLIVLSLAALLCLPLAGYAASIGGVETQGQGKFSIGVNGEYVFDRDMKNKSLTTTEGDEDTVTATGIMKSEVDKISREMVKVSYGVLDNLDIYVNLGNANADFKSKRSGTWIDSSDGSTGTFNNESIKLNGDNAFAYGFGIKGTYDLENNWLIGCDAQYLRHKHNLKVTRSMNIYDNTGALLHAGPYDDWKAKATVQEWQIAPYIAYKIENFTPYLGAKYSDVRVTYKNEGKKTKIKADDNFGVFVGTDYKLAENWTLNLEGRFVDETAMSVGTTYKF